METPLVEVDKDLVAFLTTLSPSQRETLETLLKGGVKSDEVARISAVIAALAPKKRQYRRKANGDAK